MNEELYLKEASPGDEALLLEWANESETRQQSFQRHFITPEEHHKWFHSMLNRKDVFLFLLCQKEVPIGTVRILCHDVGATLSYSIDRHYRGKGLGNEIVRLACDYAGRGLELRYILAETRTENIKSQKALTANGFQKIPASPERLGYLFQKRLYSEKTKRPLIAIRADGNERIGTGHLMRCTAIARAFHEEGWDTVFLTADSSGTDFLEKLGIQSICLNSFWDKLDEEMPVLQEKLNILAPELLLVDSYQASPHYLKRQKEILPIVYIDDLFPGKLPVDVLVNYNLSYQNKPYKESYQGTKTLLLLGPLYAPLREEFYRISPSPLRAQVQNLFVTTGGTDPFSISENLIGKILSDSDLSNIHIHLAVGRYYENVNGLEQLAFRFSRLVLHRNVTSMARLMRESDLVISAGGTTLYEICACGIPAVIFGFADNQRESRMYMGKTNAMIDCGDYRDNPEQCMQGILASVKDLAHNLQQRTEMQQRQRKITDGHGAERLAQELIRFLFDINNRNEEKDDDQS